MMRAILAVLVLAACSSAPTRYEPRPWTKEPLEQAYAECQNFINTRAGWGTNMYLCLAGKGWYEVSN